MAAPLSAAGGDAGLVRRLRDRLDGDPRVGHVAIALLAAAALLALPLLVGNVLESIVRVRATLSTFVTISAASNEAALVLEQALLDERIAVVAVDATQLRIARARFEADAGAARAAVSRVRHPERLPPGLRSELAALRPAVGAALDEFRRRLPDVPRGAGNAPLPPGLGVVDAPDEVALDRARGLAVAIIGLAARTRLQDLAEIERRERNLAVKSTATVASVLLMLAGAAARLVAGRRHLNAARARERLQTERLERAVEGMREGVALFAADMTLILRNGRFAETAGLTPAVTAIGTPYAVIADALADGLPPVLAETLGGERRERSGEMRMGARVLEVFRAAMPGGGEILTLTDVTERVESEAVARRAVKLEALGRLTSGVAHDFNNLLQGLSANLETVAALGLDATAAERRARFEAMLDLVERGTRLTRQLLSFTRARPAAVSAVDTDAVLRSLKDLLERTIGDRIELQLVLDPGLWPVLVDRSGLENAILNLAINARDAMPDGGTISIVGTNLPPASPADAPSVLVCVADSGIGMDAEQLRRATEPFFTHQAGRRGHGAGPGDGERLRGRGGRRSHAGEPGGPRHARDAAPAARERCTQRRGGGGRRSGQSGAGPRRDGPAGGGRPRGAGSRALGAGGDRLPGGGGGQHRRRLPADRGRREPGPGAERRDAAGKPRPAGLAAGGARPVAAGAGAVQHRRSRGPWRARPAARRTDAAAGQALAIG